MKRTSAVTILLVLAISVFAQTSDTSWVRRNRVGIFFSPHLSYRLLNYDHSAGWVEQSRNSNEKTTFGFRAGISYHYFITRKIACKIGAAFLQNGFETKKNDLNWISSDPDFPSENKTVFKYHYLEVPLVLNYYVFHKPKVDVFISAGISTNVFLQKKTKVKLIYPDGHRNNDSAVEQVGYSKVNFGASIGFGMEYKLSKRMTGVIEPSIHQFLTSTIVDGHSKEYLNSLGVNIGFNYVFKP